MQEALESKMTNVREFGVFLLVVWFFYSFSAYVSAYTVPIVTDLLKGISTNNLLPKGPFGILSVVVANIDQFITFLICGSFLRGLIPDNKKSKLFAMLLFVLFTALSISSLIYNYQSIYGSKINLILAKSIVVMMNFFFISTGFLIIDHLNKVGHKIGD